MQQLRETKYHELLSAQQKLGVKYFDEISKPVSRGEAEAVEVSVPSQVAIPPFLTPIADLCSGIP